METPRTSAAALIPSANFKVVKVRNLRANVPGGYILLNGWAIEDKSAGAWVSASSQDGQPIPTVYRSKCIASAFIAQGLYEGYCTIPR